MTNKLLLSVIVVLLITNVATMLLWKNDRSDESIVEDEEVDTQKPVASIGGTEISFQDWMKSLRESYGKKELKTIIDQEVVKKLAQEQNITVSEKVIERDMALLTTMQGLTTEEELKGLEESWREDIIYRYQLEALLAQDVQVPEEDVQAYFTKYDNQYQFSESFQLSHILVANRETANKVYDELEAGASFSLLAKEYSIDEDTKENGGYLGFNSSTTEFISSNYFDFAKELEEYTYSEPFVTSNGVAILFLHKKLPDITFTYEELKPYIRNELALQSINQNLVAEPLWEKVDIEWVYDE
ncbi:peptidylprolyl isomerase [Ornithinibacillus sp. FSL M8-0202]|uniref:peptidylprolyl isomerase n=1 Tax=Ornithinibacillus sp. FSL M8-0202 TaxID=2921616 RepID=UPI0030D5EC35